MFGRRWSHRPLPPDALKRSEKLAAELGIAPLTARLLLHRGCDTPDAASAFLQPRLDAMIDPTRIKGLPEGVARILKAAESGESIWIYGDYDVDGVTATSLLVGFLGKMGIEARPRVPHRMRDGYGLSIDVLKEMKEQGARLVVTVDNGVAAVREAEAARAMGIDLVVTDHHLPGERLPDVDALVNPRQPGCDYPNKDLCGVGLAFKLAWGLAEARYGKGRLPETIRDALLESLTLVALGTIADMVPLTGENRVMVRTGLDLLSRSPRPGIRALCKTAKVRLPVDTFAVGFQLAPRINAAGRMDEPDLGVRLLLTDDPAEAADLAGRLDRWNRDRRKVERAIVDEASARVDVERIAAGGRTVVLAGDDWHLGVVGLVASRLSRKFHRPAVVVGWSGGDTGRGSGRSIEGFHLVEALDACAGTLEEYGGHAAAAGMTVRRDRFEAFRDRFEAVARERLSDADLVPSLAVHETVPLSELTPARVREIGRLGPFGQGNPEPVLMAKGVRLAGSPRPLGREGKHLSFHLADDAAGFRAVAFGKGDQISRVEELPGTFDVAFVPRINDWGGTERVELHVEGLRG